MSARPSLARADWWRLAPATEMLIVGEGIESVLSAMVMTGRPGWAALSTSGLVALILPPEVRSVVIVADHDENGAGERAAHKAGLRWAGEGRRVRILTPIASAAMRTICSGEACRDASPGARERCDFVQ
jgi:hypothetical protein